MEQKFGHWRVIKELPKRKGVRYLLCQCSCGKRRAVAYHNLRSGASTSCGACSKITHGLTGHPLFKAWHRMMSRCYNPNNASYTNYGGRGITVDKSWHDICRFVADNESRYKKGLQIDRIDNNGAYSLNNTRWVSPKENSRNKNDNIMLTVNGRTQCMTAWADEVGIGKHVIYYRLKAGWTPEQAVLTPIRQYNKRSS